MMISSHHNACTNFPSCINLDKVKALKPQHKHADFGIMRLVCCNVIHLPRLTKQVLEKQTSYFESAAESLKCIYFINYCDYNFFLLLLMLF